MREALAVSIAFLSGYIWANAAPLLIRPYFTWINQTPTVSVISALQQNTVFIGGMVATATVVRLVIDNLVCIEQSESEALPSGRWISFPPLQAALVRAAVLVFVTAGIVDTLLNACIYFGVAVAANMLRFWIGRIEVFVKWMSSIPILLRIFLMC